MTETSPHQAVGKDPWLLVICLARVFLFANFMVFAACIPVLVEEWSLSSAQAGSVVTSFTVGYAISLFGFSWLADHYGAKLITLISSWSAAAAALIFGFFAQDYWSALLLYGLAGLSQGGAYTPIIMLFAERYGPRRRGAAVGWLIASTSIGYATSLAVSGGALNFGGYHAAFIATGVLPLAGAILLQFVLYATPNTIHERGEHAGLKKALYGEPDARRLVTGYVGHSWELLGMWAWAPAFLAASLALKGSELVDATEMGAYVSASGHILGAFASLTMGGLSDRLGRRAILLSMALLATGLSFIFGWLIALPFAALAIIALLYAYATIGDSAVLSTALTEAVHPGFLGSALAVRSLLGFSAGAISPLVFGAVLDLSGGAGPQTAWGLSFGMLGLGGVVAVWCAWKLTLRRPG